MLDGDPPAIVPKVSKVLFLNYAVIVGGSDSPMDTADYRHLDAWTDVLQRLADGDERFVLLIDCGHDLLQQIGYRTFAGICRAGFRI